MRCLLWLDYCMLISFSFRSFGLLISESRSSLTKFLESIDPNSIESIWLLSGFVGDRICVKIVKEGNLETAIKGFDRVTNRQIYALAKKKVNLTCTV